MLSPEATTLARWRALLLRLNQIEARARSDQEQVRRYVAARTTRTIRPQLILQPRPAEQEPPLPEAAPPCPVCRDPLRIRRELLVACTVCLAVAHHDCLAGAPCVTPACVEERRRLGA